MTFSVTCSNCDRRFVDIDESLIGQQARCRCGSIVELDPVWDFNKEKKSQRPNSRNRPSSSARPPKTVKPKKRGPAASPSSKSTKPRSSTSTSSTAHQKKQKTKQPRTDDVRATPAASTSAKSKATLTKVKTKTRRERGAELVFDNYADLDQILEAGVDQTPLQPTRLDSPFEQTVDDERSNRRGLIGAAVGGLAGLLAAFVLLITRGSAFGGTPLGWSGHAFYGTYTASYGSGEMTNFSSNLFAGFGWWLLLLAALIGMTSVLLLIRVAIQIAVDRNVLAWSRGVLATLSVVSLFSLMGLLFVQNIHHGNLIDDLDSFSSSAPLEGLIEPADEVDTFQDVREKYQSESTDFMIGVLTFAVLPLISFSGVAASLLFDEG